ncbi:histidine phosphatase family protein [Candidatus Bipolaricaulota bacterium]
MNPTTIYLIRHAQSQPSGTTANARWPLSTRGQEQAAHLAELLVPLGIETIYSSPYTRCLQTIAPFVERQDLEVTTVDDLREMQIVSGYVDDFDATWRRVWDDFGHRQPGCESSNGALQRFVAAVEAAAGESAGRTIGVSAHGMVIGLFLNHLDSSFERTHTEALTNPDVIRILSSNGRFTRDASFRLDGLASIASHHDDTAYEADD